MNDGKELHAQAQRGKEAAQVLDNPAYQTAMQLLQRQVLDAWKSADVRDTEGQRLLLQLAKLTDRFEATLRGMIETGKFAQHQLDLSEVRADTRAQRMLRKVL